MITLDDAEIDRWKNRHIPYRLKRLDGLRWWCEHKASGKDQQEIDLAINGKRVDASLLTNGLADSGLMACRFLLEFLGLRPVPCSESPTGFDLDRIRESDRRRGDVWAERIGCRSIEPDDLSTKDRQTCAYAHKLASRGVGHPTAGPEGAELTWLIDSVGIIERAVADAVYVGHPPDTRSELRKLPRASSIARRLHRVLGLIMFLPFLGWAVTGFVFFLKPGYAAAYGSLHVKTYPLDRITLPVTPAGNSWLEVRHVNTILGSHVLVRTDDGWRQVDAHDATPIGEPSEEQVTSLVKDAISLDPERYGEIADIDRHEITTTTGVRVSLDWNRLSLRQRGKDTDRIDLLYRVHYLQWTGVTWLDRVLGLAGLATVLVLAGLGLRLFLGRPS